MRRVPGRAARTSPSPGARAVAGGLVLAAVSCGPRAAPETPQVRPGVEVRDTSDHPRLGLVVREGDPFGGVAVAVAHDFGATASVWLGALLAKRLEGGTPGLRAPRPSAGGLSLGATARTPDEAARYVRAVAAALAQPFTAEEVARQDGLRRTPPVATWRTDSEAATAGCVGELGERVPRKAPTLAELEQWRTAIRTVDSIAFAAVGPRATVEAAASALHGTEAWPVGRSLDDPWPARDVIAVSPGAASSTSLSVAERVDDARAALSAALLLGIRSSLLATHAAALSPAWTVDRVVGVQRPRGACLRIDLHAESHVPARAAAGVAALVEDEMARALVAGGAAPRSLDGGILEESDPRSAAESAAWGALAGKLDAGAARTFIDLTTTDGEGTAPDDPGFSAAVLEARADRRRPSVEVRAGVEAGQGEMWMLLGSPCATSSESTDTAGLSALAVRALARSVTEIAGARIEPWVSTDGIGLLSHGARKDGHETFAEQAERLASALGQAMATTPLTDGATAIERSSVATELSSELVPLWPVALEALAPRHPSLLDPRGTWQSVSEASTHSVEAARRGLLHAPLRLAVLTGGDATTAGARAAVALERFLRPERDDRATCPDLGAVTVRAGEYDVTIPGSDGSVSRAVVAVGIPTGEDLAEAEATARLLDRPGGFLDTSVRVPGLAVFAEARVLGGSGAAALAVEITTQDRKAKEAVLQVRALLARLAEGAVTKEDVDKSVAKTDPTTDPRVDPRERVVRLWSGQRTSNAPDLAALRRFHRRIFSPERHVVVVARPRP